jgi:hypothetical protein
MKFLPRFADLRLVRNTDLVPVLDRADQPQYIINESCLQLVRKICLPARQASPWQNPGINTHIYDEILCSCLCRDKLHSP